MASAAPDYFWLHLLTGQELEKAVTLQARVVHPAKQEDISQLLNNGAKRSLSKNHGTQWGALDASRPGEN